MTRARTPALTGARIDRADHVRGDPDRLAAALGDRRARLLVLDALDPLVEGGRLGWTSLGLIAEGDAPLFLGLLDDIPHFAALPADVARIDGRSRSAWAALTLLAPDEAALYAGARSLVAWHASYRFCANCGSGTAIAKGGWQRDCASCGAQHFPRTDPVVIMLARHRDGAGVERVLVGHGVGFPSGRMSALAGFVEPGESIEEAVRRELFEEAGIVAETVEYIASQPWPFASSLMIGCLADVADPALTLDTKEVDAAIWVTREEVAAALAGEPDARFLAPPPIAIARTLLETWLG
jgi:NAD+ diphosphatase